MIKIQPISAGCSKTACLLDAAACRRVRRAEKRYVRFRRRLGCPEPDRVCPQRDAVVAITARWTIMHCALSALWPSSREEGVPRPWPPDLSSLLRYQAAHGDSVPQRL